MPPRLAALLLASTLLLPACSAGWKRADAAAGGALAPHVDTTKLDGQTVIRIRSRGAVVLIDQQGGRVIDYRLQRRPRWVFVRDDTDEERMKMRQEATRAMPNALAPPGWQTLVDPPNPELDRDVYWHVDSTANEIVLLSESHAGLRWRKTYHLTERSNALNVTVQLENRTFKPVTVSAASVIATAGELRDEGAIQRAWADDQWLTRKFIDGPAGATGFRFENVRIEPMKRLEWSERWWLERGPATTPPVEPRDIAAPSFRDDPPR